MTSEQRKNKRRQSHRNYAKSHWRAVARDPMRASFFSEENINRMKRGQAPRRLCIIRHKITGETLEFHAPLELHHCFGMKELTPQEEQTIIEAYPWQHAAMDEDRRFSWEFICWTGFQ